VRISNLASAKETSALVAELGGDAHAYELNVADEAAVLAWAKAVQQKAWRAGRLDQQRRHRHAGRFLDTPSDHFQRVLDGTSTA